LTTRHVDQHSAASAAVVVVGFGLVVGLTPSTGVAWGLAALAVTAAATIGLRPGAGHELAVLLGTGVLVAATPLTWSAPALIAIAALTANRTGRTKLDASSPPLPGQRTLTAACIAFGFASGALVIAWFTTTNLNRGIVVGGIGNIADLPLATALLIAATAAILNATAEEVIWRWSAVRLLEHNGAPPLVTQLTQAASFAIAHMGGIPRGYTGIAMTFAYALIVLPMARRSLRLAIACHAAADAVFITYLIT